MAASFILANLVILVLGLTVFHFLDTLNRSIEHITAESNRVTLLTDEIRISAVSILKYQRKMMSARPSAEIIDKLVSLCEGFTAQLQTLDALYQGVEVKQVIAKMLGYVDSLQVILRKVPLDGRGTGLSPAAMSGLSSIGDLADKILEAFSEFQDVQYFQSAERDKRVKNIIRKTKRNMMYTLIITFVGTMLLGLVVPGKIALPFKKIKDAIRELQSCNFDVSIYYDREDEIGEIAKEMNKMIGSLKKFEELRAERILIEGRKFDALANMVKKFILIANAKGELIYMNNNLYSLLQLQSDDVLNKDMRDSRIPEPIIQIYELAIKRRSKIENVDIEIVESGKNMSGSLVGSVGGISGIATGTPDNIEEGAGGAGIGGNAEEIAVIFRGYSNVIPIRGKESSLDYYLMILSEEMVA